MKFVHKSFRVLAATAIAFLTSTSFAENDGFGVLEGEGLHAVYTDHVLAGSVGQLPIFMEPAAVGFGAELTLRQGGRTFKATLAKKDSSISSRVTAFEADLRTEKTFDFVLTKFEGQSIFGTMDGKMFQVDISSEEMDGNHFVSPSLKITYGEKNYDLKLNGAKACMGCLSKIVFALLSSLHVSGAL